MATQDSASVSSNSISKLVQFWLNKVKVVQVETTNRRLEAWKNDWDRDWDNDWDNKYDPWSNEWDQGWERTDDPWDNVWDQNWENTN